MLLVIMGVATDTFGKLWVSFRRGGDTPLHCLKADMRAGMLDCLSSPKPPLMIRSSSKDRVQASRRRLRRESIPQSVITMSQEDRAFDHDRSPAIGEESQEDPRQKLLDSHQMYRQAEQNHEDWPLGGHGANFGSIHR